MSLDEKKKKDPLEDPLGGSRPRTSKKDPMDDPLGGGSGARTSRKADPMDDLGGSGMRARKKDPMDDPLGGNAAHTIRQKPKDLMDDPLGSGSSNRSPKQMRNAGKRTSLKIDDLDRSIEDDLMDAKKDCPRRTLSGDLEISLVINDKNFTVHQRYDDFGDSDSFMEDSFAGSSFASTNDGSVFEVDSETANFQFTTLDDELPPSDTKNSPGPRRNTPKRTYSRQRKMPKKVDPLMAITEDDDNDSQES